MVTQKKEKRASVERLECLEERKPQGSRWLGWRSARKTPKVVAAAMRQKMASIMASSAVLNYVECVSGSNCCIVGVHHVVFVPNTLAEREVVQLTRKYFHADTTWTEVALPSREHVRLPQQMGDHLHQARVRASGCRLGRHAPRLLPLWSLLLPRLHPPLTPRVVAIPISCEDGGRRLRRPW